MKNKVFNFLNKERFNFTSDRDINTKNHLNSLCIFKPKDKNEIQKFVKFCNKENIKIIPCGGRTNLCGGTLAQNKEVVLSLEKLNKVLYYDDIGLTLTVEAGITLQDVQEFAKNKNLFFPLDLASRGSAQIGGVISTNAGGLQFIRYGGARELILGIEVVLADGSFLDLNLPVKKNNSGYDLKQLFIGAEGTLGIITAATLKLIKPPNNREVLFLGLNSFENILKIFKEKSLTINAFEFFTLEALKNVLNTFDNIHSPFSKEHKFYVLIDFDEDRTKVENFFYSINNYIEEAFIPTSSEQQKTFWSIRENINESCDRIGYVRKNDVAVPLEKLGFFMTELEKITRNDNFKTICYGHIGDGNIHINYCGASKNKKFITEVTKTEKKVYELIASLKGSISAEHGIGLFKKKILHYTRNEEQINFMRSIKKIFDPKNILNPGKIFDC